VSGGRGGGRRPTGRKEKDPHFALRPTGGGRIRTSPDRRRGPAELCGGGDGGAERRLAVLAAEWAGAWGRPAGGGAPHGVNEVEAGGGAAWCMLMDKAGLRWR
jgi:hypothetical protein